MKRNNKGKQRAAALLLSAAVAAAGMTPFAAYAAGWEKQQEGIWKYQNEDGTYLADGFAPDGYYIDGSGFWHSNKEILTAQVPNRNHFLKASEAGSLVTFEPQISDAAELLASQCGGTRVFALEEDRITYYAVTEDSETELMSFYKDTKTDGYCLRLRCRLTSAGGQKPKNSWYDYQVMRLFMNMVSRTGEQLTAAVYSSWEEKNDYGLKLGTWVHLGDAEVCYEAAEGAGIYHIKS